MILFIIATILCAILGRMGGASGFNTKFRDMGVPFVACLYAFLLGCHSWWLILSFGLMFGALTTYWDFLFGYDQFYFHGLVIGVATAPIALVTGHWLHFLGVVVLSSLWMGFWSKVIKWDVLEEGVRYCVVPAAVWLVIR
jgi:hypothetical protein